VHRGGSVANSKKFESAHYFELNLLPGPETNSLNMAEFVKYVDVKAGTAQGPGGVPVLIMFLTVEWECIKYSVGSRREGSEIRIFGAWPLHRTFTKGLTRLSLRHFKRIWFIVPEGFNWDALKHLP
jgi:hypothetical protein